MTRLQAAAWTVIILALAIVVGLFALPYIDAAIESDDPFSPGIETW